VKKGVRKHTSSNRKSSSKDKAPTKKIPGQSRYWTPEEHKLFLEALRRFGHKDLRSISAYVGTRNMTQVRTHSQKYFMRLMREAKRQNPSSNTANATSNANANGNGNRTNTAAAPTPPGTSDADSDPAPQPSRTTVAASDVSNDDRKLNSAAKNNNAAAATQPGTTTTTTPADGAPAVDPNADKYSVPNTCGMTLLCLVGQDTLTN